MEIIFYGSVALYLLIKIFEWLKGIKRYSSNKAEFLADMYKVQMKWCKRGEYGISKTVGQVIDGYSQIEIEPETEYGRDTKNNLNK